MIINIKMPLITSRVYLILLKSLLLKQSLFYENYILNKSIFEIKVKLQLR